MNWTRISTLAVLALLAASGARASEPRADDFREDDIGNKAFILLSTSNWGTPSYLPGKHWFMGVVMEMRRTDAGGGKRRRYVQFMIDEPSRKSHFPDEFGQVYWRSLEPGDYVMKIQVLRSGVCAKNAPEWHFTFKAGDVLYLGNFYFDGAAVVLRDTYERDYAYFVGNTHGVKPARFVPANSRVVLNDGACPGQQ